MPLCVDSTSIEKRRVQYVRDGTIQSADSAGSVRTAWLGVCVQQRRPRRSCRLITGLEHPLHPPPPTTEGS